MSILDYLRQKCTLLLRLRCLQEENLRLRKQLGDLTDGCWPVAEGDSPVCGHEDLAGGLSSAIDGLQSQLSQMSNAVSDFGLREVSLQAKVMPEITSLGVLNYRLIRPGGAVDPQTISTLSLTIVPVPKQDKVGTLSPGEFKRHVGVEEIPGIGEDGNARLRRNGIYTATDFLQVGTRARSAVRLAALLDVDRQRLNEWLAQAQLLMLEGVNSQTAGLLFATGIRGLNDLASLTPAEVLSRYEKQAGSSKLPRLNPAQVEMWIKTARTYTGASEQV